MANDPKQIRKDFRKAVNMTPAALRKWLESDESKAVGMVRGKGLKSGGAGGESVGHHMGDRILEIKQKKVADLTEKDLADMNKVVGYVNRHSKQRPGGDVTDTKWRKSLMNWGHDPKKAKA